MGKCLLSVDWDYFIKTHKKYWGSYLENKRTRVDLWYKRYIQGIKIGVDIRKFFQLTPDVTKFWDIIRTIFKFKNNMVYVSDSHELAYKIAKDLDCKVVYLFDAHADLGYGGLSSLDFEVNCANWLGKLLKDGYVKEANIIYSPFTLEKPEHFTELNRLFNIRYLSLDELKPAIELEVVHICRSGAWAPPWFDNQFNEFVKRSGLAYRLVNCPPRKWNPSNLSFADQIDYLLA